MSRFLPAKDTRETKTKDLRNILLIDDEEGVLRALTLLLTAIGLSPKPFSCPMKALLHLNQEKPDTYQVVLTDLRMPGLDGFEVLSQVKCQMPYLPVIIMSGHANGADHKEAYELGCDGLLSKPFTPDQLLDILADISAHNLGSKAG